MIDFKMYGVYEKKSVGEKIHKPLKGKIFLLMDSIIFPRHRSGVLQYDLLTKPPFLKSCWKKLKTF